MNQEAPSQYHAARAPHRTLPNPRNADLEDRLTDFAVSVLNVIESLPAGLSSSHIARRLVRSGTAPAPGYVEATCTPTAPPDGQHLAPVLADLRESRVWLRILWKKAYLPGGLLVVLLRECEELIRLMLAEAHIASGCGKRCDTVEVSPSIA